MVRSSSPGMFKKNARQRHGSCTKSHSESYYAASPRPACIYEGPSLPIKSFAKMRSGKTMSPSSSPALHKPPSAYLRTPSPKRHGNGRDVPRSRSSCLNRFQHNKVLENLVEAQTRAFRTSSLLDNNLYQNDAWYLVLKLLEVQCMVRSLGSGTETYCTTTYGLVAEKGSPPTCHVLLGHGRFLCSKRILSLPMESSR